ncbi:HNH endonuclease [Priestia megaterium]|uniref:HNH endonuclease n=1 Tax=Priestia megaterium TaxID=1404 RepID=UPI00189000FA|nr:HNH endonuclease [Priestia megaterium]
MNIIKLFESELRNLDTNYFILDTKGKPVDYGDIDFVSYDWSPSKYNKVKEGDLFLYRRPSKASETRKFYFFGAGKIRKIEKLGVDRVRGIIEKALPFERKLSPEELDHYIWKFKQRGLNWEHFFNQYGMNHIVKDDFLGILEIAFKHDLEVQDAELEVSLIQQQQRKHFFVEDQVTEQKRRVGHKVFADQVKLNYGYQCAITGIRLKEFLVASHIMPWSQSKKNRLDPQNGICLSILVDKAFDKGFLTITTEYRILLSPVLEKDVILYNLLKPYENKKIKYPKSAPPKKEFLEWHAENVFKRYIE